MRGCVLGLVLLAAASCVRTSVDPSPPQLFDEATLALRRGELADAQAGAERGAAVASARRDEEWEWRFTLLRAETLIAQLKFEAAVPILESAPPPGNAFDHLRSRQQYLVALTHITQGHLAEGQNALARALALAPPSGDLRLDIETVSGQVALRLGRWGEGEAQLNAVVSQAVEARDRFHEIWAVNDLGMGRLVRNRFDDAVPWFERVLAFKDLERFTMYSVALYNAGICYARLGEFDRALALQRRAVDIYERAGPRRNLEQGLGELGNTYILQGDVEQGLPYLERALRVATEANLREDAALWGRNLADTYAGLGRWDEAERFNEESKRLNPEGLERKLVYNTLATAEIAAGRGQLDDASRLFEEASRSSGQEFAVAWEAAVGLADIATSRHQPAVANRHFEAALKVIEQSRSTLNRVDFRLSYLNRLIRFYQKYVDELIARGEPIRALEVADSSRGRVLAERQGGVPGGRASGERLRQLAARTGGVWLSYWLTPSKSIVWVVSASGIRTATLPDDGKIAQLVREHQANIANAMADPLSGKDTAGDALYRMLIAPVASSIPKDAAVVIVPDGALHGLNFETLPVDSPRRHYWIEDVEVQVAPSLASLRLAPPRGPAPESVLVIGNPTPRPPDYPALGYASAEMASVVRHFKSTDVTQIDRERASPAAYQGAHPERYQLVHFTAHATANIDSPLDSAVILSGLDGAYKLYARDVAEQPLRAELVTVSACRSAGERAFSGEGLVGFSWAFLRAGAERVVAGLWDVDDRSTASLMDRLYAEVSAGVLPGRALRRAKLAQIRADGAWAKPYYWAPFELFTVVVSPRERAD